MGTEEARGQALGARRSATAEAGAVRSRSPPTLPLSTPQAVATGTGTGTGTGTDTASGARALRLRGRAHARLSSRRSGRRGAPRASVGIYCPSAGAGHDARTPDSDTRA